MGAADRVLIDPFDHPEARRSEVLAFDAEIADRKGNHKLARTLYAKAADAAEIAARECPDGYPRCKTALEQTAVACREKSK